MKTFALITLTFLCAAVTVFAELKTRVIEYKQGNTVLEGYLAWDDSFTGPRPAVLVVHDWMGIGPYSKGRAEQIARLGYVAFAADIYGKDSRPTDQKSAGQAAGKFKNDRPLMRARATAGLEVLRKLDMVNKDKIAAIGYCFGGTVALELARGGAPLAGTVSIHGGLDTPNPADAKNIRGRVFVQHGADDPNVPTDQVLAFQQEMRAAKIDWQMNYYGNAVHAFTVPTAGNDPSRGAAYNQKADKRSWEDLMLFFTDIFGMPGARGR